MKLCWTLVTVLAACSSGQLAQPAAGGSAGMAVSEAGAGAGSRNECGSGGSRDPNACTEFDSACSFEDTCNLFGCGQPWSSFDANLCKRERCRATSNCPDGQLCVPAPLFGHFGVTSTGIGGCQYDANCECRCGSTADAVSMAYCVDPSEIPEECSLDDVNCQLALTYMEELYLPSFASDPDVGTRLQACASRLEVHCGNVGAGGSG